MLGRALPFSERRVVLMLGDSVLVAGAALASLVTWWTVDGKLTWQLFFLEHWFWLPILISTWLLLGWILDLYDIIVASSRRAITHRVAGVVLCTSLLLSKRSRASSFSISTSLQHFLPSPGAGHLRGHSPSLGIANE